MKNIELIGLCGVGKTYLIDSLISREDKIKYPNRLDIFLYRIYYIYKIIFENKLKIKYFFRKDIRFLINNLSYRYLLIKKNKNVIEEGYFVDKNIFQIFITYKTIFNSKNSEIALFSKFILKNEFTPNFIIYLKNDNIDEAYNNFINREKKLNRVSYWGDTINLTNRYQSSLKVIDFIEQISKDLNIKFQILNRDENLNLFAKKIFLENLNLITKNDVRIDRNQKNITYQKFHIEKYKSEAFKYYINAEKPDVNIFKDKNITYIVFGRPIFEDKINKEIIKNFLINNKINEENILKLNGEFLIFKIDNFKNEIKIINDRFASVPLYYSNIGRSFFANLNYIELIKSIKSKNIKINLNNSVLYEFLHFRKIHGINTYHNEVFFMDSTSILTISANHIDLKKYWYPDFTKNNNSLHKNSLQLKSLLENSISLNTQNINEDKLGLFLSGGMDTRLLLSCLINQNKYPRCYTLGYSKQGEYKTVKEITKNYNLKHNFLKLPEDEYDIFWEKKINISSYFHVPYHNIFMGFKNFVSKNSDLIIHGHGLDFLFQGMYLPLKSINILNRKTYYNYFHNLNNINNFIEFYYENVAYRNWRTDLNLFSNKNDQIKNSILENLSKIYTNSFKVSSDNFDRWEYFMIENLSRHYSQTDVMGISSNCLSSKISNENNLFDFYLSLPRFQRKDGKVQKKALYYANYKLSQMKNANTNFKIIASPTEMNIYFFYLKLMRLITNNNKFRHPESKDRTWPDHDNEIIVRKKLKNEIKKLMNSEVLFDNLTFLNRKTIRSFIDDSLSKRNFGAGQFLMALLTVESFLKEID